jgi:hypothetical protein
MAELWSLRGLSWRELAKRTCRKSWEDEIFGQSARLAFYFFFAIFPVLLLLLILLGKSAGAGVLCRGGAQPRLVHLSITPNGEETFSVADARHRATLFAAKVAIGGIAGMIAPLITQTASRYEDLGGGEGAPAFVRADEALYVGGPIWSIQITGPEWVEPRIPAVKQQVAFLSLRV